MNTHNGESSHPAANILSLRLWSSIISNIVYNLSRRKVGFVRFDLSTEYIPYMLLLCIFTIRSLGSEWSLISVHVANFFSAFVCHRRWFIPQPARCHNLTHFHRVSHQYPTSELEFCTVGQCLLLSRSDPRRWGWRHMRATFWEDQ